MLRQFNNGEEQQHALPSSRRRTGSLYCLTT